LTKRHLTTHGLTPEQYKEKYGYKKGTSLVAKSLARSRRKTMQDMKLWERRKKAPKGRIIGRGKKMKLADWIPFPRDPAFNLLILRALLRTSL
jgi:hypothetical protein